MNLRHGVKQVTARTGHEKDTCTACAGTMLLEFAALSRLTDEPIFEVGHLFYVSNCSNNILFSLKKVFFLKIILGYFCPSIEFS